MEKSEHEIVNEEYGTKATVFKQKNGKYIVSLHDIDAGKTLPCHKCFQSLSDAIRCAETWADISEK